MIRTALDNIPTPPSSKLLGWHVLTATITMTVNFLSPARPGPIIGEAKVTQLGRTVAFVEGRLTAEDGTLLATATTSARLVETAKAIASSASSRPVALPV